MPFDFGTYRTKCDGLTTGQLHKEWENYTRQVAGGATSTATAVLFSPLTAGISLIGLGLSAPRVHNARKKRKLIEACLNARGENTHTRKRDVVAPMAISGIIGGVTLGLAGPGADFIAGEVVGKGAEYAAAHIVLDATGAVAEHKHDDHTKKKSEQNVQTRYQDFQKQYVHQQAVLQATQPNEHQLTSPRNGLQNRLLGPPLKSGAEVQIIQAGTNQERQLDQYQCQAIAPSQSQKYGYIPALAPKISENLYRLAPSSQDQKFDYLNVDSDQQPPPYSSHLVGEKLGTPPFPSPSTMPPINKAAISVDHEIALLQVLVLCMEIETCIGIDQINAVLFAEQEQPKPHTTLRADFVNGLCPVDLYPPPPVSPSLYSIPPSQIPMQKT